MYKIFRSLFFLLEAEKAHYVAMNILSFLCRIPGGKKLIAAFFKPKPDGVTTVFNLNFPNPIGLGAGFDKNARYLNALEALGFGFVEIGTVTPKPQAGNAKPRLFRLKKDAALINRMGFNNDGVVLIAEKLKQWRLKNGLSINPEKAANRMIIGGNIGKNKDTPNEEAWKDYLICFETLHENVDYFVVNVSSPNTPGLRELQEKESLQIIFEKLKAADCQQKNPKPVLLKIAPDLTVEQVDDVIALALEIKLDGLVVSNTTLDRSGLSKEGKQQSETIGAGGLSGKPLTQKATDLILYIFQRSNGKIPIIGSGGIFSVKDAETKYAAGATLLQVWTGFIYEGPSIIKQLLKTKIN